MHTPGFGDGPTLVLAAHGSRDPRFAATTERVAAAVRARLRGITVRPAYLDLNSPTVGDVIAETAGDQVVVPLLFADGYHSSVDLPSIITERRLPGARVTQSPVIGTHPLASALADRLHSAGLRDDDGVILCAVGSSNPAADDHVRRRARELTHLVGRPVVTVFATRLGENAAAVAGAVEHLRGRGAARIALSPYFLSAGLLIERMERALDVIAPGALVAAPLGAHPDVVTAIVGHYLRSVGPGVAATVGASLTVR
ncbi:sirohydrochlorin chelatase [Gordonia soli]|uniref:Putative ferrochelatase n=1 Tax=Gordonia soli NBRC 108243 TaxID=1223545 RepID=M0QL70_9ACTN|nr:sirohydrochlorin chelatase [Gordonia soli]GAC69375.1 putative ferrochelatase [Gordonia soli NBRC 108243]